MAQFSMGIRVVSRAKGQSIIAAAAYRAGERLWDERLGMFHDFRHKQKEVEHSELLFPADAPAWTKGMDRQAFWGAADSAEVRRDAQLARDLRIMIPREVPVADRVPLVRDYVLRNFVAKGMVADICFHNYVTASDGLEQPHAHVLFSMRPLVAEGFGNKSRHEYVKDPSGRTHPDGRPVMIESNPNSWNSAAFFERSREDWEKTANAALERAGSSARVDRRSHLEKGLSRLPQPMLGAAFHMRELYGRFKDRFGQYLAARHAREVEQRAKVALDRLDVISPAEAMRTVERFRAWFDRQLDHLPIGREGPTPQLSTQSPSPDMER
ncbi:MobA/MobL family protein [Sphingobium sp. AN641]|uniref:MobA/MobL family protein n=1 Tax=Sphingobium sp. AN641 TaxID=3133443 RepID=UPI0030BC68AC